MSSKPDLRSGAVSDDGASAGLGPVKALKLETMERRGGFLFIAAPAGLDQREDPLIDRIDGFARTAECVAADLARLQLVEAALGEPRRLDRRALDRGRHQHFGPEEMAQHRDDLRLRLVVRIVARDEVMEEILPQHGASILDHADEVAHHQQELAHRGDVQHCG